MAHKCKKISHLYMGSRTKVVNLNSLDFDKLYKAFFG